MKQPAIQLLAEDWINKPTDSNFNKLYGALNTRLRFFIWRYVKYQKDATDVADEILQQTYNCLFNNLHKYDFSVQFVTWIFSIAKNECFAHIKKSKKFVSIDDEFILTKEDNSKYRDIDDAIDCMDEINYSVFDIESRIEDDKYEDEDILDEKTRNKRVAKKRCEELLSNMNNLPEAYKDLLIDKYFNNMQYIDIAIKYKLNLNTVRTRLRKGKTILLQNLKLE